MPFEAEYVAGRIISSGLVFHVLNYSKKKVVFFLVISFQTGNEIVYYTVSNISNISFSVKLLAWIHSEFANIWFALTRKTVNCESNQLESKIHRRFTAHCGACSFLLQANQYLLQSSGLIECQLQQIAKMPIYCAYLNDYTVNCILLFVCTAALFFTKAATKKTDQSCSHLPYICTASNSMNRTETL